MTLRRMVSALRQLPAADSWEVTLPILAAIVLLGGALRFHGLDWDASPGGHTNHMHPDERFLSIVANDLDWPSGFSDYLATETSPANPYNLPSVNSFVYGTVPLYAAKAVATWVGDDPEGPGNSYDSSAVWGRRTTAAVSTATIVLVFGLGLSLFNRQVGLLAALLYALAVLPTQLAHFWTVDPWVTFFGTATLFLAALIPRDHPTTRRWLLHAAIGLTVGLGMACKVAFWPFVLAPVLATMARAGIRDVPSLRLRWGGSAGGDRGPPGADLLTDVAGLFLAGLVSMLAFRIAQPSAFVGPGFFDLGINAQWWNDLRAEGQRQSGMNDVPPFVQFAARPPYLEPLKNMVLWGLGPVLGFAALTGVAAAAVSLVRRRDLSLLLLVALPVVFLLYFGGRFVVFMRYFDPIYPILCLAAAWGLSQLVSKSRAAPIPRSITTLSPRWRGGLETAVRASGPIAAAATVAATAWWAIAFQNVYREEHPRLQASRWIYEHVASGESLTSEVWDDALPYPTPGYPGPQAYRLIETEPYETDSVQKVSRLVYGVEGDPRHPGLAGADYVVISSDRVRKSVPRLPAEYPATMRYYELLDSGELGFELAATFSVRPSFLGVSVDDSGAEESFTVYDHPSVRIYQKTASWDPARAAALLMAAYPDRAVNLLPAQGRTNGLQFTPDEAHVQQTGGTFSDVFSVDGITTHWPAAWWFVWLELAAFAALPMTVLLFAGLPDRGYGLSKILGPLAIALACWLLVAWGVVQFSSTLATAVFASWLAFGVISGVSVRRRLAADAREHWRQWLVAEGVFVCTFLFFLGLRWLNPDTWHHPQGGEKPMELAYLTAVVRSTEMPPYDPWFAGGSMNYYYWGWFFLAVPIRALRLLPEVAFNLGVPTFASLAASVAFSTTFNLASLSRRALRGGQEALGRSLAAGLTGAFLLVFAGNLDGLHQTLDRLQQINRWRAFEGHRVLDGPASVAGGVYRFARGTPLPPYDWWRSSRVHIGSFDITEFPYWSFSFADLHPHLMGLPFLGLVLALAVALAAAAMTDDRHRTIPLAAILGLAVALVRAVHTWDLPTALVITAGGLVAAYLLRPAPHAQRARLLAAEVGLFGVFFALPMLPYSAHTEVFNQGIHWAPERTPANQYLAHFGVFVIIAAAYIVSAFFSVARAGQAGTTAKAGIPGPAIGLAVVGIALAVAALTWSDRLTVVAVSGIALVVLGNLAWAQWWASPRDVGALAATVCFALGFAIAGGVDVVTLDGDIVRMNTVFKFSLQAWQLFAVAGGVGIWYVLDAARDFARHGRVAAWMSRSTCALAAGLLAVSAIYIVSGTPARLEARFPGSSRGLDGLAYLDEATYGEDAGTPNTADDRVLALVDDRPLIDWLRQNVEGTPVIVEAVGPLYHWTGRISMNTGLPAVIGWDWHQIQQRWTYTAQVNQRRQDTASFYRAPDVASAERYLRKYNVSFVIVGTEETVYGTPEGLARLANVPALTEVFRSGSYAIYRVDQSQLPPPTLTMQAVR